MQFYDKEKVFLEIRDESNMLEQEKELLKHSELGDFAKVEVWSAVGTNHQLAYSAHGAFRYFGKFPPPIATYLINSYTKEGETVFDPMCGSGTTGVEALLNKRNAILNDVNPLSTLLAKVKTTKLSIEDISHYSELIYSEYKPLSFDDYHFEPSYLKNYTHWFLPETVDSLRGIKFLIDQINDDKIKNFFNVCFAATIRRVSRATTQQGRLFLDAETAEKDALPFFQKRVDIAAKGVTTLPKNDCFVKINSLDLRNDSLFELHNCADLIICHPPYFNSYKYSSINSLELAWLDFDHSKIRKNEVREFFKVGKEENAIHYVNDMVKTLKNLHPTLKQGCCLALMIGDTTIHGNYIPVTKDILEQLHDDYDVELVALRAPKYTEAAWVASQRRQSNKVGITLYDFIIVLRKK